MGLTVEQLFLRYRAKGDARSLAEVFERTAPEILRIAMHLASDPATAEDLLQATFVTAMETADAFDVDRPLVPWLLGILTNQSHKRRRRDAQRPDPTRFPAPKSPDPSSVAGDLEFSASVAQAVDDLHDPYRQVLVLHLRHGLAPVEIANVLRRSPGTVRSQLARGLEFLRNSLPVGFTALGLGLLSGRGLAAIKRAVMDHAAHLAEPVGVPLLGAFAMKKTLLSLGALLLVAALAVLTVPQLLQGGSGGAPGRSQAGTLVADAPPPPGLEIRAATAPGSRETSTGGRSTLEVPTTAAGAFGSVLVRLSWEDTGAPATGVAAYVVPWERSNRALYQDYRLSDINGVVHYEEVFRGRITVYTMVGAIARGQVRPGQETIVEVRVPRGITIAGEVVDHAGNPVADAEVWLCSSGAQFRGVRVAQANAWGQFQLRGLRDTNLIGARSRGFAPSRLQSVGTLDGDVTGRSIRLVLPGPGTELTGIAVNARGEAVAGAAVQVHPISEEDEWGRIAMDDGAPLPLRLVTAADGSFHVGDLPVGTVAVLARLPGLVPARTELNLRAGEVNQITLVLQEGVTLLGQVTDGAGAPLLEAHVESGGYGYFSRSVATTDVHGRYRLEGLAPDPEVQAFTGSGRLVVAKLTATAGDTLRWDPVLRGGNEIRGRLLDAWGQPLAGWSVWVWGPRGHSGSANTDADGNFIFSDRLDEEHILEVRANGDLFTLPPLLTVTGVRCSDGSGEDIVELRVPEANLKLGAIAGQVFDPQDRPTQAVITCTYGNGQSITVREESHPSTGLFVLNDLPPMEYRLTVQASGYPPVHFTARVHPGAETDLGSLQLQRGSHLSLNLQRSDGASPQVTACRLQGPSGPIPMVEAEGQWTADVNLDTYRLTIEGENFLPHVQQLVVEAPTVEVSIHLLAATRQRFHFQLPESGVFPFRLHLLLLDARGEALRNESLIGDPTQPYEWTVGLAPGKYQLQATSSTGLGGEFGFEIPRTSGNLPPITVTLR